MAIETEPIGSIPRPPELIEAVRAHREGRLPEAQLEAQYAEAVKDTLHRFEQTGSPVLTDGEQRKASFATYPLDGLDNVAPEGVEIPFADGHVRCLPRLTRGPFRYAVKADRFLREARELTDVPVKQAVIAPSALSLIYPEQGVEGYPREQFLEDLVNESASEIRACLDGGAHVVQLDFTEGRLAVKIDPSKTLLDQFIELNNRVLDRFSDEQRYRIGVHTCPGGDLDSTHSLDVDYAELLPKLFELRAKRFYMQLASEPDRRRVLGIVREHSKPDQKVFVGVIDPINPEVETVEQVRDRVVEAAEYLPLDRLGTTDDCGFSPFGDDVSTARERAFDKIRARVEGTDVAARVLGA
ncbi:MAG: cobalamin-independent methionine synthase II family protein [Myxococcota bacterium]